MTATIDPLGGRGAAARVLVVGGMHVCKVLLLWCRWAGGRRSPIHLHCCGLDDATLRALLPSWRGTARRLPQGGGGGRSSSSSGWWVPTCPEVCAILQQRPLLLNQLHKAKESKGKLKGH